MRGLGFRVRVFSCVILFFVNLIICVVIFVVLGGFWEEMVFDFLEDVVIFCVFVEIVIFLVMLVGIGGFLGFIS